MKTEILTRLSHMLCDYHTLKNDGFPEAADSLVVKMGDTIDKELRRVRRNESRNRASLRRIWDDAPALRIEKNTIENT